MNSIFSSASRYKNFNIPKRFKRIHVFGRGVGFGAEFLFLIKTIGSSASEGRVLYLLSPKHPKGITVQDGFEDYFVELFPKISSQLIELTNRPHFPGDAKLPVIRKTLEIILKFAYPDTLFMFHKLLINKQNLILSGNQYVPDFWNNRHHIAMLLWRFNRQTKKAIYLINSRLTEISIDAAVHIRRGDKIEEAEHTPINAYIIHLQKFKRVYIATDDHRVIEELKEKLPGIKFFTQNEANNTGYDQRNFNNLPAPLRYKEIIIFLAEMEIMRTSDVFIGSSPSNVYYLARILRNNINTIDVNKHSSEGQIS